MPWRRLTLDGVGVGEDTGDSEVDAVLGELDALLGEHGGDLLGGLGGDGLALGDDGDGHVVGR